MNLIIGIILPLRPHQMSPLYGIRLIGTACRSSVQGSPWVGDGGNQTRLIMPKLIMPMSAKVPSCEFQLGGLIYSVAEPMTCISILHVKEMCIETALKQVGKAQFSTGSDMISLWHWLSMSIHDWWSPKLGNVRARDVLQHLAPWAAVSTCPARILTKVRSAYQWSYGSRQKKDPFKIEGHLYLQQNHIKVTWTCGKKAMHATRCYMHLPSFTTRL